MHYWGDEWFQKYGTELNEAITELNQGLAKIHICVYGKEKYGTYRTDCFSLWDGSWYHWFHGYTPIIKQGNKSIWSIIRYHIDKYFMTYNWYTGITQNVRGWQIRKLNRLFQEVCKQHPDIVDELISDTDCYQYIKRCRYGKIDGDKIHKKYWKLFINSKPQNN